MRSILSNTGRQSGEMYLENACRILWANQQQSGVQPNMRKRKALTLLLAALMLFATACGGSAGGGDNGGSNAGGSSGGSSSSGSTSSGGSGTAQQEAPRKVELKVFLDFPRFKEDIEAYFAQFKDKMLAEQNIEVKIDLEMPSPEQAGQILQARLASNDAPDVYSLHANNIPTFYSAGYLHDLSDQPFVPTLYENVRESVTYDGKVVALPLESLSWGYLYNKAIFRDLGLSVPQTLDEMRQVVDKLNASGIPPFLLAFQESWGPQLMTALSLGGLVSSEHPDWIDKMNAGEASYADVRDIFNIIDLIMNNGTDKPFEVGSAAGAADFANGKAAMWIMGPWMAESMLEANPNFEFGIAPLPVSNDPAGTMINLATSTSLAVSPTSKNMDVALALVNYMLDPQDSAALFEKLKFNPISTVHNYETFPWIAEASEYVAQGRAYLDLKLPNGVTDEQAKLLQSYYAKQVTVEDFIETMDRTWANAVKNQ